MVQLAIALEPGGIDIAACGYGAVRAAFQHVLGLCTNAITRSDLQLAANVLGCDVSADLGEGVVEMVTDTALYSRPGDPWQRRAARRAVDRIARKLPVQRDPLMAALASRLPTAIYSVFEVESIAQDGTVVVKDLLDGLRPLTIKDVAFASTAQRGYVFAGRFIDAGAWYMGFGIVHVLAKSEATAICLALAHSGELEDKRDSLHELVYPCRLHGDCLVLEAITPLVAALSLMIDTSDADMASIVADLTAAIPPTPERAARRNGDRARARRRA